MSGVKISELPLLIDARGAFMPVAKAGQNYRLSPFSFFLFTTGGSANNYTLNIDGITSYHVGLFFITKFHANNTGASSMNINGLGTKEIRKGGASLTAGDIVPGTPYMVVYDGNYFELVSGGNTSAGDAWLLSSGGALTGHNNITGAFRIGFDVDRVGIGVGEAGIDTMFRVDMRGVGNTAATGALKVSNADNDAIILVYDDGTTEIRALDGSLIARFIANEVEIGGTTHLIKVPDTIPSGSARIEFRDNVALAYIIGTQSENFVEFRSTSGSRTVRVRKRLELSFNNSVYIHHHYELTVPATASATTVITSIPIDNNTVANINSSWALSATDGNCGGGSVRATVKNISGTTSLVGMTTSELRLNLPGSSIDVVANNTSDTIDFVFTNATAPNNRAYKINLIVMIQFTPVAS